MISPEETACRCGSFYVYYTVSMRMQNAAQYRNKTDGVCVSRRQVHAYFTPSRLSISNTFV